MVYFSMNMTSGSAMMKVKSVVAVIGMSIMLSACSTSQKTANSQAAAPTVQNEDLALHHILEGSVLDTKQEYAKAILEYQDADRKSVV